jgi:hypothetical protein
MQSVHLIENHKYLEIFLLRYHEQQSEREKVVKRDMREHKINKIN